MPSLVTAPNPPTISPNVFSEIGVDGGFTVAAGETLYATAPERMFWSFSSFSQVFNNFGLIWIDRSPSAYVIASMDWGWIYNAGIMVAHSTDGYANTIFIGSILAGGIINQGSIYALSDTSSAIAVQNWWPSAPITNGGTIAIYAGDGGTAIYEANGGNILNGGSILAEGGATATSPAGLNGIFLDGADGAPDGFANDPVEVTNYGVIEALSHSPLVEAYAIRGRGSEFGQLTIVNHGLIKAETAIRSDFSVRLTNEVDGHIEGKLDFAFGNDIITNHGQIVGTITTAAGSDVIFNSGTSTGAIDLGSGHDIFYGLGGTVTGVVSGGDDADLLIGSAGADAFNGGAGNDVIIGGGGDSLAGGTGADRFVFTDTNSGQPAAVITDFTTSADKIDLRALAPTSVVINGSTVVATTVAGTLTIQVTGAVQQSDILTAGSSSATGTATDDTLVAGLGDATLTGAAGSDLLVGGQGNDRLDGGSGSDTMWGGAGDDVYVVDESLANADGVADFVVEAPGQGTDSVESSVSFTLPMNVENLTLVGPNSIDGGGNDLANVLVGNTMSNILNGGLGNDTLVGGGGDVGDTLNGGGGADLMIGGAGDDLYRVDDAGDVVVESAGEGSEWVESFVTYTLPDNVENLYLRNAESINGTGNSLDNQVIGNPGDNLLSGGAGNDVLVGDAGNDRLDGGAGDDTIDGGFGGTDTAYYATAAAVVQVSLALSESPQDTVGAGTDTLRGIENLTGSAFADTLTGDANANVLEGGDGDDALNGGAGSDTASYASAGSGVTVSLVLAGAQNTGGASVDTLTGIENLTGSAFNDTLTGDAGANVLNGGAGADTLIGGAGNDSYVVDQAGDVITEVAGQGEDTVVAKASYGLAAGVSVETMTTVTSSATTAINLTGNEFGQSLYGNAGNNILTGMGGSDYLVGLGGNDWYFVDQSDFISELVGGGDDWIFVPGTYILREGTEIETLVAVNQDSLDPVNLTGNEYGQSLYGSQGANALNGGAGNDYLVGLGGDDFLLGGLGNDNMGGGQGNDIYYVDSGDWVIEAAGEGDDRAVAFGSFALRAGESVETLAAAEGNAAINLTGNALAQSLYGNAGANVLTGGGGADYLVGGAGTDTFVLGNPNGGGIAAIADYAAGEIVDITQVLAVAGGTDVVGGGYLKITAGGQIQVDANGGGDNWVTLSNINGAGSVTIRYLAGGSATDLGVAHSAGAAEPDPPAAAKLQPAETTATSAGMDHDAAALDPALAAWHLDAHVHHDTPWLIGA